MYVCIYERKIKRDRGDAAAVGNGADEPRNLSRQEGTPLQVAKVSCFTKASCFTGELLYSLRTPLQCSPFYGRACRWAMLGELKPKGPKGGRR